MLRKSAAILALIFTCLAPQAFALGLGAVTVESYLNQPLRVRIEVLQLGDTRLEDVTIQVAAPEDFVRFGIERAVFLNNIRFRSEATADGNFVVLTTNQIVREPYLSFILETRWSNGRLLSEHTILLDLPVFQDTAPAPTAPVRAPISAVLTPPTPANNSSEPRPQSQPPSREPSQSNQPVLEPEIISPVAASELETDVSEPEDIALQSADVEVEQPEPLTQAIEVAETSQEAVSETVIEDAQEVVTEAEIEEADQEADTVVPEDVEAAEEEPAPEAVVEAETQQTVISNDAETLTDIALRVRPNQSVSLQQTMLAIQELNPDAFIGGNINRLRAGQELRIPTLSDIQAIDQREAIDEVARQNRQTAQADIQPLAAPANTAPAQEVSSGQLSVITGEPESDEPGASSSGNELDRRIAELETQLALREEEADRARLEREEMESRLADLDEQIAAAQEIIRLQDLQLAQLQQSLADAAAEAELAAQQAAAAAQLEAPPVAIRQPSFLETLLGNSMLLIAGAGVLVLGLVMILLRRNKSGSQEDEDLDEIINEEEFNGVTDNSKQDSDKDKEEGGSEFQDYNDADLDSELDDIISVGTETDKKKPAAIDPDLLLDATNIDDICAQADRLLEQDNIKQAENLLRAAIEDNPGNDLLSAKLLEVFAKKGDLTAFDDLASELKTNKVPAIDKKIDSLRAGLAPAAKTAASFTGKTEKVSQKEKDDTASFLDDLGIDLDSFEDDTFELADDQEPSAKPVAKPSVSIDELDADNEPAEMDLTFDLADDPEAESNDAEDSPSAEIDREPDAIESFEFSVEETTKQSEGSDDSDELEIDTLEFESDEPATSAVSQTEPPAEVEELETFAFESPSASANESTEAPATEKPADKDENLLDFDFDKSELEAPATEAPTENNLETFDFDLKTESADTVIENSNADEISFDLDEELEETLPESSSDEATIVETQGSSKDFDFDLSELEISADDIDDDLEISLSDDDFLDLDEEVSTKKKSNESDVDDDGLVDFDFDEVEIPASPVADLTTDDDDLNFLTDDDDDVEVDVSAVSIDDDDDDTYAMSDEDETATKLELAYAYQKMGDADGAKEILLEVIREGTPDQVKEAKVLMQAVEKGGD